MMIIFQKESTKGVDCNQKKCNMCERSLLTLKFSLASSFNFQINYFVSTSASTKRVWRKKLLSFYMELICDTFYHIDTCTARGGEQRLLLNNAYKAAVLPFAIKTDHTIIFYSQFSLRNYAVLCSYFLSYKHSNDAHLKSSLFWVFQFFTAESFSLSRAQIDKSSHKTWDLTTKQLGI